MVEKDAVSKDFRKQVLGYGLTTAEIVYRRPDRPWLLRLTDAEGFEVLRSCRQVKLFVVGNRRRIRAASHGERA